MKRIVLAIASELAPLAPLAFTSLTGAAKERVGDAKAQALRSREFGSWDAHELVDAQKHKRVESALAVADEIPIPAGPLPCTAGFAGPYPCRTTRG